MLITFECRNCGTNLEIEAAEAGTRLECPACKAEVTVPRKGFGPGATIGGFRIDRLLGKGGMGEVYLARQLSMDRDVALKILPSRLTVEKELVDRFLREVRLLAKLEHPNIVTAYEAGEDGGVYFMAMAYVNGSPLDIQLQRDGSMPEKRALRLIQQIASALAYAWSEHSLIHRDIKPGNIMVDKHGDLRLLDLGLSKNLAQASEMTMSGSIVGTPNYMSPEQAEGRKADIRSDMYSLGMTLYHMVTGQVPFAGSSIVAVLRKQATEALPDPQSINPDISDACAALLEIMLAKDPAKRHADWNALIADIERVHAGAQPTQEPPQPGESVMLRAQALKSPPQKAAAAQKSKKSPALWIAAALAAILAAVGGAFFAVNRDDPPAPAAMESQAEVAAFAPPARAADGQSATRAAEEPLAKPFAEAMAYQVAHPADFAEIRSRLEPIAQEGSGTEIGEKAKTALRELAAAEQHAEDEAMAQIERQAESLFSAGRSDEASAGIQNYVGPFAEKTRERRQVLSELFAQRAEKAGKAATEKAEAAKATLGRVIDETAAALFRGDAAAAEAGLATAEQDAALKPLLADVRKAVDAVASMPKMVLDSFRDEVGREVAIGFTAGLKTLKIASVGAGEVRARRQIATTGYAEVRFTVDELSLPEKFKRLEGQDAPVRGILRGLLLVQGRRPEAAAKYFRESGTLLGEALAAQIDQRMANATEKAGPAGFPAATPEKAAAPPRRIESAQLAEVVKRIEQANPQVASLASLCDVTDTDVEMDLSGNPELTDITPLKGMPLTKLNLAETKVADLDPLKGMPLRVLNLADTPLTRLSALKGLPLEKLDLTHCRVTDYRDLSELPLTELKLFWAWATDLKPLKRMPLTHLNIDGHQAMAPTMDLRPLADLPLVSLSMVNTPVTDLTPLKGLSLTYLNAELCKNLKDLSPLKGMPLETLNIQNTAVDNLSPLAGMPLQVLNICNTKVSNLTSLKGMTTLTTLLMYYGEQCRILSPFLENLQKGNFDAAEAGANAMADTLEGVPALGSFVHLLRALAGTRIAEWKTMAGDDIKSLAKSFNGHSYAIPPIFNNLKDAQAYGRSKGAHLATIGSQDEMDWVTSTFALPDFPIRLGGSDEKKEGTWEWLTGEPWGFSNWGASQPDNWQGNENSIGFSANGKWSDIIAEESFFFLLEWDQ